MKNVKLKIITTVVGTMIIGWFAYLTYAYGMNVKKSSWESTMLVVSGTSLIWECFLLWIIFGMDLIKRME